MATTTGLHVLIVDDEFLIRWAVGQSLSAAGHSAVHAVDAVSARRVLESPDEPIDVVLLDSKLPDCNGLALLPEIRRLRPHSAVVMITAEASPEMRTAALRAGVYQVLDKPFDLGELAAALQAATRMQHSNLPAA
jgi:DNA-binding NtrC family response regulator